MVNGISGKHRGNAVTTHTIAVQGASTPKALKGFKVRFAASTAFLESHRLDLLSDCVEKFNEKCKSNDFFSHIAKTFKAKDIQSALIIFSLHKDGIYLSMIGYKERSAIFKTVLFLGPIPASFLP